MTRTIAAAALVVGLAVPLSAQDKVQQGGALFSSQKCVMCHSVGARGNKKGPLDDVGNRLKADEIRHWLTEPAEMRAKTRATRTPEMKDLKLTRDQVDALVAFLQSQKAATADVAR